MRNFSPAAVAGTAPASREPGTGREAWSAGNAAPDAGSRLLLPLLLNGLKAPHREEDETSKSEGEERQSANP